MTRWRHRIYLGDIFGDPTMAFEARQSEITRRIKRSWFFMEYVANGDEDISDLVQGLVEAEGVEEYDDYWERFYEWADQHSVKVETDPNEDP